MPIDYFLFGAGGHGKVVYEAWSEKCLSIYVFDGDKSKNACAFMGTTVSLSTDVAELPAKGHVAIGNNATRRRLSTEIVIENKVLMSVIHLQASVSKFCEIGSGCFVAAGAIVGPDAILGKGVIVNHGAIVDHDCYVGQYSHISPNVTLGGGASIGEDCLIGAGAVILPEVRVANGVTVGAGAVVVKDITDENVVVCGIPARAKESDN